MPGTQNIFPFWFSAHFLPLFGHGVKLSTSLSTQAITSEDNIWRRHVRFILNCALCFQNSTISLDTLCSCSRTKSTDANNSQEQPCPPPGLGHLQMLETHSSAGSVNIFVLLTEYGVLRTSKLLNPKSVPNPGCGSISKIRSYYTQSTKPLISKTIYM